MKQTLKQFSLFLGAFSGVLVLAVAPVGAEHGNDSTTATTTTATTTNTNETQTSDSSTSGKNKVEIASNETETETETTPDSVKTEAEHLLSAKRQSGKQHSVEDRQKACTERQKSLDTRQANFATAAQRHLDVFNSIFMKVKAFHDSKQLNVTTYDQLVATATAKQTAAQAAVDTLKATSATIDCTQPDPATSVAKLKAAVADARTALQAYRSAIKDVVVALQGASTSTSTTTNTSDTTGSNQ